MAPPPDRQQEKQAPATVLQKPVLPATFANSFWSSDYRTGLESLFTALEGAAVQSKEVADHVDRRIRLERTLASGLVPPALRPDGFALVSEARARQRLADDLERTILAPFTSWSAAHASRLSTSRSTLFSSLTAYESHLALVSRLKSQYDAACRQADLAEDEWNFVAARDQLGREHVPPRPDDDDDDDEDDRREGSKDGRDSDDGDDDGLIGRSGATGRSVLGALGRALSVRRTRSGSESAKRSSPRAQSGSPGSATATGSEGLAEGPAGEPHQAAGQAEGQEQGAGLHLPTGMQLPNLDASEVRAGLDWSKTKFSSLLSTVVGPHTVFERYERARKDADAAEDKYKREAILLDRLRLSLEEAISTHLPYLQRCESDRLRAATSVLKSFHGAISTLPKLMDGSLERVGQALDLCRPEKDLKAIIERRKTGPFQPSPAPFQSHYSDEPSTTFGIDLRKFDETNGDRESRPLPRVLELLLEWAEKKGQEVSDDERRKSWLYDVPLASQHALRAKLNSPGQLSVRDGAGPDLSIVDLPVLCATTKLWLLELEQPPFTWAAYDELRTTWPSRGTAVADPAEGEAVGEGNTEAKDESAEKIDVLAKVVGKLPKIHFDVLHLFIRNLAKLVEETTTDEPLEVYLHKLSLSLARPLLRPKHTTPLSLDDRFPAAVVALLLSHQEQVFRKAGEIAKKEREERYRPRRQRTKPVDERVRRSNFAGQVPPVPPARTAGGPHLQVDTTSSSAARAEGEKVVVVASPMAASSEELPVPPVPEKEASAEASSAAPATEDAGTAEQTENKQPEAPASPVEAPFSPPTPEEAPFSPPTTSSSAADAVEAPGASAPSATPPSDEKPLAASSSLKRSTGPGSGRLRGARGPRPASQVLARVAALEHEHEGGGGAGGETGSASRTSVDSKRESWTS
ncbi:Rho-GTPase-activating protein 8 [Rhodotorula sphaerocarpa]